MVKIVLTVVENILAGFVFFWAFQIPWPFLWLFPVFHVLKFSCHFQNLSISSLFLGIFWHNHQLNSMSFQAWKLKYLNSMTFQVFPDWESDEHQWQCVWTLLRVLLLFFFNWHVYLGHEAVEACTMGAAIIVGVLGLPPTAMTWCGPGEPMT